MAHSHVRDTQAADASDCPGPVRCRGREVPRDERRRRPTTRRRTLGWGPSLALGLVLAAPPGVLAKWHGIDRLENRIVFAGTPEGTYRETHRHLRLEDTAGGRESYEAHWRARDQRLPLLRLRLHLGLHALAPGHPLRTAQGKSLERLIRTHPLFRGRTFAAVETGIAHSVSDPAEYLVFEAGRDRCGTWRLYPSRHGNTAADVLDDTLMTGLYCPVSGEVDAARLTSVLARVGIRGIAVPETEESVPDPPRGPELLARLVKSGDMTGLRRIAARGLDPDSVIPFSHPRFAGGRTIRRPMLVAASLHGHVEMTVYLLDLGAATGGAAASAICAAVAGDHPEIVEALLEANAALAEYEACGRGRSMPALAVARRLDRTAIVELLRAARDR